MDSKRPDNHFRADNIIAPATDKIITAANGTKEAVSASGGALSLNPLHFINSAGLQQFTLYGLYNIRFNCHKDLGLPLPDKVFCVFYNNASPPALHKYEIKIISSNIANDTYHLQFDWPNIAKEEKYQGYYNGTVSLFWEKYGYYNVPFSYIPTDDKRVCYPLIASGSSFFNHGKSYIVRNETDTLKISMNIPFIGSIVFSDIKAFGKPKPTFIATVQNGWDMSQDNYMNNPFWDTYWEGNSNNWEETPDSWGAKAIYLSGTKLKDDSGAPIPKWTSRCQLLNTIKEYWGKPQELEYPIVFIGDNGNIYHFKILCDLVLSLSYEENITITGLRGDKTPVKDALQSYMKAISLF